MKYRKLGRSGFEVSEVAQGLWGMSGWSGSDDRESLQAMQSAVDLGCNFFDTAWAYGNGKSDGMLGQILASNKSKRIYAASKVPPKNLKWPGSSKDRYTDVFPVDHVFKYAEKIRAKLGVDAIDVLQFHVWDDNWTADPQFRSTVEKLKSDGLIRSFGLSINRWEPENGLEALRTGVVDVVQVIYNVFDQAPEDKLFSLCRQLNVGVIARVPLDEGSLGGKMTLETKFPAGDWRAGYFNPANLAVTLQRVDKLKGLLTESAAKMTLPEMALRFIVSNPDVSTIIAGMRKPEHVKQNMAVSDAGGLDAQLLQALKGHRWNRKPAPWSD